MNDDELLRYSRHIMLEGIDLDGQERLGRARVLIVGLGGLGSPAAMYLAASGVGRIDLADDDVVELSNLQRQIVHGTGDIGRGKAISAAQRLADLNPLGDYHPIPRRLGPAELDEHVEAADVVLDGSDNFATRFAVNTACVRAGRPLVSGAAIRTSGQMAVFDRRTANAPCYRCLYAEQGLDEERSCSETGVLSPLVGVIGSLQAVEAIKLITGLGEPAGGRLTTFDALTGRWRTVRVPQDPACPVCGGSALPGNGAA